MFPLTKPYALVALTVALFLGIDSQALAQYSRKNAIVEAVEKTKEGIITLKVLKSNQYGGRSSIVGTGVIVDQRGYAITNHHVIAGADKVTVTFADKTTCQARVVVEDSKYDLAILRVPVGAKQQLKALTFGPGSDLMVGETVIAIGNPYGFANTVSTGIISALDRQIAMPSGETLKNLIQTNASINPGNSGGPLVNINGELIGINVALREGAQGIAFALNTEVVKSVLCRHLSALRVSKVSHGIGCTEAVEAEGKTRQRLVVAQPGATGSEGGLQKGDHIVRVGNLPIYNRFDLERGFWGYKADEKVNVTVLRDNREVTLSVGVSGETRVATSRSSR